MSAATDAATRVASLSGVLSESVAAWTARDSVPASPRARRAARDAVDAIDAMVAELYRARQQLVAEARADDDAAMARSHPATGGDQSAAGRSEVAR